MDMRETTIGRARAGDEQAFRELTDPYRRELQLHCYRILGSLQDAEDLLQETLLAAWRGLDQFEGRSSLRAWLYRIATNRCLNALRDCEPPPLDGRRDLPEPDAHRRAAVARALSRRAARRRRRRRSRARGAIRDQGVGRARVRQRPAAPAAATARGPGPARRARDSAPPRSPTCSTSARPRSTARCSGPARRTTRVSRHAASARRCRDRRRARAARPFAEAFEDGDIDGVVQLLTDDALLTMPPRAARVPGPRGDRRVPATTGIATHRGRRVRLVPDARQLPAGVRSLHRRRPGADRPLLRDHRAHARGRPHLRDHPVR